MRRFVRSGVPRLSAAILVASLAFPSAANAGHGKDGLDPDNKDQSISIRTDWQRPTQAAYEAEDELNRSVITTSIISGDADIQVYDGDYDQNQWFGETSCTDWNHNAIGFPTTCDDMSVKMDIENLDPYGFSVYVHVACHEFGHTADLGHRSASNDSNDNSCMRNDEEVPMTFDTHDIEAIEETF